MAGNFLDRFSWYTLKDQSLIHDVEVLLLRILLPYLLYMTRQRGHFTTEEKRKGQNR